MNDTIPIKDIVAMKPRKCFQTISITQEQLISSDLTDLPEKIRLTVPINAMIKAEIIMNYSALEIKLKISLSHDVQRSISTSGRAMFLTAFLRAAINCVSDLDKAYTKDYRNVGPDLAALTIVFLHQRRGEQLLALIKRELLAYYIGAREMINAAAGIDGLLLCR